MNSFSNEKYVNKLNILSLSVAALIAVFTFNLALITDVMMFVLFYVVCAAAFAWLASVKGPVIPALSSLIGWAVSLLLTDNALLGLLSISYLPFALSFPFAAKRRIARQTAVGIGSFCITASSIAAVIYLTYIRVGSISLDSIRQAFPYLFTKLSDFFCTSFYINIAGSDVPIISASNVTDYLNIVIYIAPALISASATMIGFIIGWFYNKLIHVTSVGKGEHGVKISLPSVITVAFFTVGVLIVALSDNFNAVSLTALNFAIILFPCIMVSGLISSFSPIMANGFLRPRFLRPITLIISILNGVIPFVLLCVIYGIYDSIIDAISKRKPKNSD